MCFHPKDPNDAAKGVCGWTWSTPVKPTKRQKQRLGINANLVYADDVSFESSNIILHIKNKHVIPSSPRDHRHESAFITGAAAALASHSAESTAQRTDAAVITSRAFSRVACAEQQSATRQHYSEYGDPEVHCDHSVGEGEKVGRAALSDDDLVAIRQSPGPSHCLRMSQVSGHDGLIRLDGCTDVSAVIEGVNQTGVQFLRTALATSAARVHQVLRWERVRTARP